MLASCAPCSPCVTAYRSCVGASLRAVFDSLAHKLQGTLAEVRNRGTLTERDVDLTMREIRLALLEADVNFQVVKQLTADLRERCAGAEVIGRLNPGLHVDEELMGELVRMRAALEPHHLLLVVDAMTGQDAVNVAKTFAEAVDFDGAVISKLDGDARGGAALSVRALTGKPILFASTGEKLEQFELFHPDRMAQRILGMGDVMSLIEAAEHQFDEDEAQRLERKLRRNEFGLDDFLAQLKMVRRMGPLTNILGMLPGLAAVQPQQVDERELDRIQAIILSM